MEEVESDPNKAISNEKKHKERGVGLTFKEAEEVFLDPYAIEFFFFFYSTIVKNEKQSIRIVKNFFIFFSFKLFFIYFY